MTLPRSPLLGCLLYACLAAACSAAETPLVGQQQEGNFQAEVKIEVQMGYLLFLPQEYDQQDSWPLLVFLHGAGERGSDLDLVKKHGPPKIVESKKDFPFVVLSPQCGGREWWRLEPLKALIDKTASQYKIDQDRIYVTGLSMGGFGTWALASAYPHKFAAIAPICGGGDPKQAERIKHLPVWAFHGAKDEVVPSERSQEMVDALKAAGGNVRLTIYPDAGHDSWTESYDNPELYSWLLQHKRTGPAAQQ
jgi:predicted peptidase